MRKGIILLIFSLWLTAIRAVTLTSRPGELQALLDGISSSDATLTLQGMIGPEDFETLASLEGFEILDMTDLLLTGAKATPGITPDHSWPSSDIFPAYALFGAQFKEIRLPSCVTEIQDGALAGSGIERVELPKNLKAIGAYAFYKNDRLEEVKLPARLNKIGVSAFDGCSRLKILNIGETQVKELPDRAIAMTRSLDKLDCSGILSVGREALFGAGVRELDLRNAVSIGPFALASMTNLKRVSINPSAKIEEGLFMGDENLKDITGIPAAIPALFAADCEDYNPENAIGQATVLGDYAFSNTLPIRLVFSPGMKELRRGALAGCTKIIEIDASLLAGYTPIVARETFEGVDVESINLKVAQDCESLWRRHPVWGRFIINGVPEGVDEIEESETGLILTLTREGILARHPEMPVDVEIYDLSGRRIISRHSPSGELLIPLADIPGSALIVNATTDAARKTMKVIP